MLYSFPTLEEPVYTCLPKGSNREAGVPRRSAHWVTARRARFRVYSDRVEAGDWRIPYQDVERAVLYRMPYLPFVEARVLELEAAGQTYQFGFNPWAHPEAHLPIAVEEEQARLGYSAFSIAARVVLVGYVLYLLWNWIA